MSLTPNYYRDRVCLNVLAGSKENAVDIYEAAEGHVLVGVLSKNYPDIPSAVADMQAYAKLIDNALSIGLGAGDPRQSAMVAELARRDCGRIAAEDAGVDGIMLEDQVSPKRCGQLPSLPIVSLTLTTPEAPSPLQDETLTPLSVL